MISHIEKYSMEYRALGLVITVCAAIVLKLNGLTAGAGSSLWVALSVLTIVFPAVISVSFVRDAIQDRKTGKEISSFTIALIILAMIGAVYTLFIALVVRQ